MNNFYVYEIREKITNKVIYIGETPKLIQRWKKHISVQGNFNNKMHYMNVLENEWVFANRKDAIRYQIDLQKYFGFETETEKRRRKALKDQSVKSICPYCNIKGKGTVMQRWHFNNCKMKNNELVSEE